LQKKSLFQLNYADFQAVIEVVQYYYVVRQVQVAKQDDILSKYKYVGISLRFGVIPSPLKKRAGHRLTAISRFCFSKPRLLRDAAHILCLYARCLSSSMPTALRAGEWRIVRKKVPPVFDSS